MTGLRWVLLLLLGAGLSLGLLSGVERRVIYEKQTQYNHIIVEEDDEGLRYLLFDEYGGYQSVRSPGETDKLELPYSKMMMVGLACVEEPKKCLIIGLGGGSIPSFLHKRYAQMKIDCVDIDPEVIAVAKEFFDFEEGDMMRAHAADGRKFIEESRDRYDVVFLDAYGDDAIPEHLTTREFLRSTRAILSPKGVVVGNLWGRASNRLYDSMVKTYQDVFDEVYVFPVPLRDNVILLGVPRKGEVSREALARSASKLSKAKQFPFDLGELVDSCFQDSRKLSFEGKVLEDEKEKQKEEPRSESPGTPAPSGEKKAAEKEAPREKTPTK